MLEANGFLSTPEQLQQLAELASVPEVLETDSVDWRGDKTGPATVCAITWDEKRRVEDKAEIQWGLGIDFLVLFEGEKRSPLLVRGPKTVAAAMGTDELGDGG